MRTEPNNLAAGRSADRIGFPMFCLNRPAGGFLVLSPPPHSCKCGKYFLKELQKVFEFQVTSRQVVSRRRAPRVTHRKARDTLTDSRNRANLSPRHQIGTMTRNQAFPVIKQFANRY